MRVIYFIVAFWVSYLVFKYGVTPGLKWLGRDSDVTTGMSTRPWPDKIVLADEVVLETPFKLNPTDLEVPEGKRDLISDSASYFYQSKDLSVASATVSYRPGVTLNLGGAADGALARMRAVPGTKSVDSVKRETVALGDGGMEIEAQIARQGETLEMHGLFFLRQQRMYQLIFIATVKHKERTAMWDRMKASMRFVKLPNQTDDSHDLTGLPAEPTDGAKGTSPLPAGMQRRTGVGAKPAFNGVER